MRGVLPILCGVLLLIGGGLMVADATQTATGELPMTYTIMPPAVVPTLTPSIQPDTNGIAAPVDQLAMLSRPATAGGYCPNGICPLRKTVNAVKTVTTTVTQAVVSEEGGGSRRPLRAVVAGIGSRVKAIIGVERRQARRAARRGE